MKRPLMATLTLGLLGVAGLLTGCSGGDSHGAAPLPSLTPEPGTLAFTSTRDGNEEIYVMQTDGSGLRRVTDNAAIDYQPSLSPNGQQVAFASNRDGQFDLYVANTDGSGTPQRMTSDPADDVEPAWSPDGLSLAWTRETISNEITSQVLVRSVTVNDAYVVVTGRAPAWSPDSSALAFASQTGGVENIARVSLDSPGSPVTVTAWTDPNYLLDHLSWSTRGIIACGRYDGTQDPVRGELYTVPATGGPVTRLTNNTADDGGPNWSPSGAQLVCYSNRDGNYELYALDATGAAATRLTNNAATDAHPTWRRHR